MQSSICLDRSPTVRLALAFLLVLTLGLSGCSGSDSGSPRAPGQYDVQRGSVRYDGNRYQLAWSDKDGTIHQMQARNLKMVRDDQRTYLEVPAGGGDPILHLREDEPITVEGRDNQGAFSSPWFPFLLGAALGNGLGNRGGGNGTVIINQPAPGESRSYSPATPAYRYPPTDSFGRGDELHGTIDAGGPQAPDYRRVAPAPYATSGQSAGTGGGTAATNKAPGSSGASSSGNRGATTGSSGGTGGGTAASNKGGFSNGSSSAGAGVGAGSSGALKGGGSGGAQGGKPSGGVPSSGSGKGIGGARSGGGARR